MSSKKIKLLESAQKNFLKGLYDKAISEYRQIIQIDPVDIRHRQRLAEILIKANQKDEAIKEYTALAKNYVDSVHYLKAIAVYKQIQKLDPSNPDISLTLASLNEKQGLIGNATAEYAAAIQIYESNGENLKALKALEAMLAIDPGNYAVRMRVAEKYFVTGREEQAATEFVGLARELQEKNDETGFQHVTEKINKLFREGAAALFARIDESYETADQHAEPSKNAEPPNDLPLQVEPVPEGIPVVCEETLPELATQSVEDSEEELIEDIQPIDESDEIEEGDDYATFSEDAEWEEDIDLEVLATEAPAHPELLSEISDDTELGIYSDLEELELEIDEDELPDSDVTSADFQLAAALPATINDSFDLAKDLSSFADEIDFDLIQADKGDTVFELDSPSGFKKCDLDTEDTESHYSLGLAYREMGLFDEAIGEFIVASRSVVRKVDCLILQGICFREIGNINKAVEILTDTLNEPDLKEDEILGIKYELAVCHESVAEIMQARQLYTQILTVRPDFSDTAARLSQL